MSRTESKLLTEVELELMNILWMLGEGTVRDVLALIPEARSIAYTSASTIIRILEQKGVVGSRKQGKAHIYFPKVEKAEYEAKTLSHMISNVFDSAPSNLVRRLVTTTNLTSEERQKIRKILKGL